MTSARGHALAGNDWSPLDGIHPSSPPSVSVIVAHYRQPAQLARTLRALSRQDHPRERLEIIVADDGSPETPAVPAGVRLVRQADDGFRLAAVRNLGAAAASGDVLVFLDADTTPEPGFIRELTRLPALAPDAVTVGRRRHARLDGVPIDVDIVSAVQGRALPEPAWLDAAYRRTRDLRDADDRSYRFVIGAVLACSRPLFDEIGGFAESFTAYGGEDWEFAYRAWIAGGVLAHVRAAVAWHDGPDAAGRAPETRDAKNAEALVLADLIPVPGSRGRGVAPAKADIVVSAPPPPATAAQRFVSLDSALAGVPGAESLAGGELGVGRFDRVRLHVDLLRPVRVAGDALAAAVGRVIEEQLGELVLTDADDRDLVRVTSARAAARAARWGRTDLFPSARTTADGIRPLPVDVDVEAYLGGWG